MNVKLTTHSCYPLKIENRETLCTCPTVNCTWSKWEEWSASCGPATRKRVIETTKTTVQKPSCDGLSQSCTEKPEVESKRVPCECPTVNCTWDKWSDWDGECGVVNRTRSIVETKVMVKKDKCEGLPQQCTEQPQKETKNVQDCKFVFWWVGLTLLCRYCWC